MSKRFDDILGEITNEVIRSIEKHGEQGHLPMGTGPETRPLDIRDEYQVLDGDMYAWALARHATVDTKAHSANEGGDDTCTWWLILREEVFEAAAEDNPAKLRAELVQTAAVVLKMIDALDHPTVLCRDCAEGKHGACIGSAFVENGPDIDEVECRCPDATHEGSAR